MSKYRIGDQVKVIEAPEYLFHGGEVLGISGDGETVFVRAESRPPVADSLCPYRGDARFWHSAAPSGFLEVGR